MLTILLQDYISLLNHPLQLFLWRQQTGMRSFLSLLALKCDMWLALPYSGKPGMTLLDHKTSSEKWHSCMQQPPLCTLCCLPNCIPYSTPSPVIFHGFGQACKWQMDSGHPGSFLSPCLIHEQGAARCPSSHTMSETHSSPCTMYLFHILPENLSSLTESPVTFSLYLLLCPHPAYKGSHNSYSQL